MRLGRHSGQARATVDGIVAIAAVLQEGMGRGPRDIGARARSSRRSPRRAVHAAISRVPDGHGPQLRSGRGPSACDHDRAAGQPFPPVRRAQALHAATFLIDQDRQPRAPPPRAESPVRRRNWSGSFDIAGKQDDNRKGSNVAEEIAALAAASGAVPSQPKIAAPVPVAVIAPAIDTECQVESRESNAEQSVRASSFGGET